MGCTGRAERLPTFLANQPSQGNGSHWGPFGGGRWGVIDDCEGDRPIRRGNRIRIRRCSTDPNSDTVKLLTPPCHEHQAIVRSQCAAATPALWMQEGCADVYSSDAFRHVPGVDVESLGEIPNTIPHVAKLLSADQETEVLPLHCPSATPACRDRMRPEPLPRQRRHDPNPRWVSM